MALYKSCGLTAYQQMHQVLFEAPKNSICSWAIRKIHYFDQQKAFNINLGHGLVLMRVIAVAMPFFAAADVFCFKAKALFTLVIRVQPKIARKEICKGLHSIKLIATSFFALPFSIFSPLAVYKDDQSWKKTIKQRFFQKMMNQIAEGEEIKQVLHKTTESLVKNERVKKVFVNIEESIAREINPQKKNKELIISQYVSLFADILSCAVFNKIPLDRAKDPFDQLIQKSIILRNPRQRRQIFQIILDTFSNDQVSWDFFCKKKFSHFKRQALPFFIVSLITKESKILDPLLEIAKDPFFKDRIKQDTLLKTLITIKSSEFDEKIKKELLFQLIICFKKDKKLSLEKKNSNQIKIKGLKKKERAKEKLIVNKERKLEEAKDRYTKLKEIPSKNNNEQLSRQVQSIEQQEKNLKNQKQQLEKIREEISQFARLPSTHHNGSESKPFFHFEEGTKNLLMLLALKDQQTIQKILSQLQTKRASLISDFKVVSDLFSDIFKGQIHSYENLNHLRAPFALITFFSRIKTDSSPMRKKLIASMQEVIHSILENSFWKDRHDETKNPHLKKIFSYRKNLKSDWMYANPQVLTVGELMNGAHERFKDYQVLNCKDPTDILLIGDEMHTCVHLHGRLSKVKGLMGFVCDGKTHTIAVKNEEKKIVAETQLQLMWDDLNQKPVLYIDQINFKKAHRNDYTLEKALYNFAKKRAKQLELDLVTHYKMKDPKSKRLRKFYRGSVKSLGSSSPLEYVNYFHTFKHRVYDLGKTYLLQKFCKV